MELFTILIMSIILLIVLVVLLKFNQKNVKLIKEIGGNKELNELTNALPENEEICKDILKMLENENVTIKSSNEGAQVSLYVVATNSIFIANIKNTCTRVQTIAHECIHSIQDKSLLWFNFIFSNIYLLYFVVITVLTVFKVIKNPNVYAIILLMMSILLYFVRSFLETDAMTKAKFLAKEYMLKNENLINREKIETVVENYDKMNSVGIKFYNLNLLTSYFIKVIIYCVVAIVIRFFI